MARFGISIFLCILIVCPAAVDAASIGVFADPNGYDPSLPSGPTGLVAYYLVLLDSPGSTAAQFSAPMPACFPTALYLSDSAVFPVTIGDSQSGVAIGFGACLGSPVHMLTINVFVDGSLPERCCEFRVLPDPNVLSGNIEFVDCNNQMEAANGLAGVIGGANNDPIISNMTPVNGATAVPLATQLWWAIDECPNYTTATPITNLSFGTTPDPPTVGWHLDRAPFDPGVLQPNTTYYWKLFHHSPGWGDVTSPVISFTTEGSVSTTRIATWGAIKEMMRD